MVLEGSPDPPDNLHDDLTPPVSSIEIQNQISDSEDEDNMDVNNYEGYAPLPVAPSDDREMVIPYNNSIFASDSSDEEDDDVDEVEPRTVDIPEDTSNVPSSVPAIESVEREVCRELWAGKFEASNIEMNSEKVQQVINVMANINLPSSSIPVWAQNLSDEEWKQEVVGRINRLRQESQGS